MALQVQGLRPGEAALFVWTDHGWESFLTGDPFLVEFVADELDEAGVQARVVEQEGL